MSQQTQTSQEKTQAEIKQAPTVIIKKSLLGDYQEIPLFKDVNPLDWEDWHWQIKNRIRTREQLEQVVDLSPEEIEGIKKSGGRLSMAITPYWASLMDKTDPTCPMRRQAVPLSAEHIVSAGEMIDPCAEDRDSPIPHLVHRYPDRVLVIATDHCAMYCRHCTRRRLVGENKENGSLNLQAMVDYIKSDRKIRDVLISGGDPLMFEDDALEETVKTFRSIPQIEFLRIGTRVPVSLPQRVTEKLILMLKKYSPLWISMHFNHPKELTRRCKMACNMLADAGFPLGSQTVLLKGINDKPYIMRKLMHDLLQVRVRPYYIYQCDPARGTSHFRTPVSVGINIIEKMRGHTSGYAVPTYVVDAPGGGGKIPVGPNYMLSQDKGKYVLRNYRGKIYNYIE